MEEIPFDQWNNRQKDEANKLIQEAEDAREDPNLYRFLKWKYGYETILEKCGEIYPVAIFPAHEDQQHDINSVLSSFEQDIPKNLITSDAYLSTIQKVGLNPPLIDRALYRMTELKKEGELLKLNCALGTYFQMLQTSQALEWELLRTWVEASKKPENESDFEAFDQKLKLRGKLHAQVDNPIRDGRSRIAGIGVLTLIAFLDEDGKYYLWVKRRSKQGVGMYPGSLHVIPSGMFAPASLSVKEEFDKGGVIANIWREYLEEVFNKPEPEVGQDDWRYIDRDERLQYLLKLIEDGEAQLYFTGVAVQLPNLLPEICSLLLIKTPKWHKYHSNHPSENMRFNFNGEYATIEDLGEFVKAGKKSVARIPYSDNDEELIRYIPPSTIVPDGAAAFWMGVDTMRRILKQDKAPVT